MRAVLLDTGPIVGLLHKGDVHHETAIDAITASVHQGRALATTWEIVGETFTLIRTRIAGHRRSSQAMTVLQWVEESGVKVIQSAEPDQLRAIEVLRSHPDIRISYVDALILAIAERMGMEEIQTVDGHLAGVRLERAIVVTVV